MKQIWLVAAVALLGIAVFSAVGQDQTPPVGQKGKAAPNADPYANNEIGRAHV